MPSRALTVAATAVAVAAVVAGCSLLPDGQSSSPGDSSTSAPADESGAKTGKQGAGVEDIDVEDVVAEQTVRIPERPEDEVTIGVHSLAVEGDVMVLRLVLTPQFASESSSEAITQFAALGEQTFSPRLVDGVNLKEYSIVGSWKSSELGVKTVNGSPMLAWAYYAAPEDDIESVDVRVADMWPAFTDVPISR